MRDGFILTISFLVAGCILEKRELGEECGGFNTCVEGLRCVDGTCSECGAPGETCCYDQVCDHPTMACVDGNEGYGICDGECGAVGLECCGGDESCPISGMCHLGTCIDAGPERACNNPSGQLHVAYVIDAMCNAQPASFKTTTVEEAEECRQALMSNSVDICPLDVSYEDSKSCGYSDLDFLHEITFPHCTDAWLEVCKSNLCPDCTWIDVALEDDCPAAP